MKTMLVLTVTLTAVLPISSAEARRSVYDWLPSELSDSDLALMRETAREQLTGEPVGTTLEWRNPETGSEGTVTLRRRSQQDGHECRDLRHSVLVRGKDDWVLDVRICEQAGGDWKVVPRDW
jgi:surface antigen